MFPAIRLNGHIISILDKCNNLNHLKQLQSHVITLGHGQNHFYTFKLLRLGIEKLSITAYARLHEGITVLLSEEMPEGIRDKPFWNSIVAECMQNELFSKVIEFFRRMILRWGLRKGIGLIRWRWFIRFLLVGIVG
ncbi:unnamed protein product [Fraxinus pennsylvanica]|uniref:Uncharacterized protein n=1 Tax=Fraxinus pennsylvanica TaxID=56036 RepID=A0AAD1ZXV0_9LAMI|nr:unnamed protein product [Fraxinus pennsylvanica]